MINELADIFVCILLVEICNHQRQSSSAVSAVVNHSTSRGSVKDDCGRVHWRISKWRRSLAILRDLREWKPLARSFRNLRWMQKEELGRLVSIWVSFYRMKLLTSFPYRKSFREEGCRNGVFWYFRWVRDANTPVKSLPTHVQLLVNSSSVSERMLWLDPLLWAGRRISSYVNGSDS